MWTSHWPRGRPKGWCTPQTPVVSGEELHEAEEAILAGCCQNFQNSRDSSGALEVVCVVCMRGWSCPPYFYFETKSLSELSA